MNAVAMIGCFDTKADDFQYLYHCLKEQGLGVISINLGVKGSTDLFPIDVNAEEVAKKAGVPIESLREENDRSSALDKMGFGASLILADYYSNNDIQGVIGMGGGGGEECGTM